MKVVRIFLGGSITLLQGDSERKGYRPSVVDPLISSLNSRKNAKELYVVKTFADLEHEAKPGGQQSLFNHYLTKDADIAIFILENEIGSHSSEELELALENRHRWGHPLVYIYGKDIDEESQLIKQLNNRDLYFEPFFDSADLQKKIRHDLDNHPRFRHRLFPHREAKKEKSGTNRQFRKILFALISIVFVLALWGFRQYRYYTTAYAIAQRRISPRKERGLIYGNQGEIISHSDIKYDLYLDCTLIRDGFRNEIDNLASALAAVSPNRTQQEYKNLIISGIIDKKKHLRLCRGIDNTSLNLVSDASYLGSSRALIVEINSTSKHPFGHLASRTIGQARKDFGYGLEQAYSETLNGDYGYETVLYRRISSSCIEIHDLPFLPYLIYRRDYVYSPASSGTDLHTSLNMQMQAVADSILRNRTNWDPAIQGACLIVMDVHKGAIRTIVNLSRNWDSGQMGEIWNASIAYMFNPGSLFDPVLFASMFTSNSISKDDLGIVISGKKRLSDYYLDTPSFQTCLKNLRLSESYPFDVEGWAPPYISEESPLSILSGKVSYDVLITPLHILSFYNTIANHGVYRPPYLVKYIGDWDDEDKNHKGTTVLARAIADAVRDYLQSSANKNGYSNESLHILGQTSLNRISAKSNKMEYQPSFVGFFPEDNPVYSIACMLYTSPAQPTSKYNDLPQKVVCEFVRRLNEMEPPKNASTD